MSDNFVVGIVVKYLHYLDFYYYYLYFTYKETEIKLLV